MRRTWGRRVRRAIGITLVCAFTLAALTVLWENWRLEPEIAALRRSGAPTRFSDLAKHGIHASENAALIYEQAFKALRLSQDDEALLAKLVSGQAASVVRHAQHPEPGRGAHAAILQRAQAIFEANRPALALLQPASRMPRCRFDVAWEPAFAGRPQTMEHLKDLRTCARLLNAEAVFLAQIGQPDAALETCGTVFALGNALAEEPSLISQLVRYALVALACKGLDCVLEAGQPSAAACARLSRTIGAIDLLKGYQAALAGERVAGLATFRLFFQGPRPPPGWQGSPPQRPAKAPPRLLVAFVSRILFPPDALSYLRLMKEALQSAPVSYRELRESKRLPSPGRPSRFWPQLITYSTMQTFSRVPAGRDRAAAYLGLARAALALKQYQAEHGDYPGSLSALEQTTGSPLPLDPFSGKQFGYRREGSGFFVYSWGPDLRDDNGVPRTRGKEGEDLVFECTR